MTLPRIALINPNTNPATTARMLAAARRSAAGRIEIVGLTAEFGVPLITDEAALAVAADAVRSLLPRLEDNTQGIVVSAFGDPGAAELEAMVDIPVVGIGEASLREAGHGERRFCVATTTPGLVAAIDRRVHALGLGSNYAGTVLTSGDAVAVTNDPVRLEAELGAAVARAVRERAAEAVVIGGGPLSDAAQRLVAASEVTIVEPVPAAIRRLIDVFDI